MTEAAAVPRPAAALTALGVVPFAGGAALTWAWPPFDAIWAIDATIAYGAVILSFIGGVHWGFAASPGGRGGAVAYGLSVLPSLIGWGCVLLPLVIAVPVLMVVFLAVLTLDRRAAVLGTAPPWWMRLRLPVTAAVVACLAAVYAALLMRI